MISLPKDPNEILKIIGDSDSPIHEALIYSRALMGLTKNKQKYKFWYKAELNLLMMILLYVARAESFAPARYDVKEANKGEDFSCFRNAASVAELMTAGSRVIVDYIGYAVTCCFADRDLLYANYSAFEASGVYENVAAELAVEWDILEYLYGMGKHGRN